MPATAILRVKDENGKTYDIPALRGKDGKDGYTPQKGIDYFDGLNGINGKDGTNGSDGADGTDGKDGANGFSPIISVVPITGGHRLTITNATGTNTVDIMDGKDLQGWASVINNNTVISFTPADKTEYRFPNATSVNIICPSGSTNYECWIYIGGKNASFSISGATQIGTVSAADYSSISAIEISIKDGRFVVGFSGELI